MKKNKIFFCSPGYTKPSVQSAITCGGYAGFQPHHQPCRKFLAAKHEENLSIRVSATPIFPAIRSHTLVQDGCYRSCSAGFISYLSNMQDFLFFVMFFYNFFYFFTQKKISGQSAEIKQENMRQQTYQRPTWMQTVLHIRRYIRLNIWCRKSYQYADHNAEQKKTALALRPSPYIFE